MNLVRLSTPVTNSPHSLHQTSTMRVALDDHCGSADFLHQCTGALAGAYFEVGLVSTEPSSAEPGSVAFGFGSE